MFRKTFTTYSRPAILLAALALTQTAALAAPPGVRYVRADAAAGGDGLSWATAYNDLRAALTTAGSSGGAVTELWVKQGTYLPGPAAPANPNLSFTLVNDVGVYGGFAGAETDRDQRDPAAHLTTLDGHYSSANAYNVVIGAGNVNTILDGFTITGGFAFKSTMLGTGWAGGGIHVTGTPSIRNCIITANGTFHAVPDETFTRPGGGAYCATGSAATFTDCIFSDNVTTDADFGSPSTPGTAGPGAGLAADHCTVTLTRCVFSGNTTGKGGWTICQAGAPRGGANGGPGGGVALFNSAALIRDCIFADNATGSAAQPETCGFGGTQNGRDGGNGAGLYATASSVVAINCLFIANHTANGGHGGDAGGSSIPHPGGNGGSGAGVWATAGSTDLINCTFAANVTGAGGAGGAFMGGPSPAGAPGAGAGVFGDATTRIANSIVWNQTASEIAGSTTASYSDVFGGYAGTGNINADPQFINAGAGDAHLPITSPCIDAGNSLVDTDPATFGTQPLPDTDLDGLPRRVDIASVPDTGVGAPVVDMGAYEVQSPGCAADLNGDGQVDFSDYLVFLNLYDAQDPAADFNHDGQVDFSDYLEFLNHYDAGC